MVCFNIGQVALLPLNLIPSDAKRPCSTCVRSHTYALSHAAEGALVPPNPVCTFDESERGNPVQAQDLIE